MVCTICSQEICEHIVHSFFGFNISAVHILCTNLLVGSKIVGFIAINLRVGAITHRFISVNVAMAMLK